ncbi:Sugar phosphatase YidA [bacterium HR17]|uniref:Sugar phosphatase YidA n=1 Tax=Candidatus Fervidibacter japonicus TaxID=2035412 RepID=A0A2H5XG44_9BACT|nr:Sugar phosphatase YidA [bacterium HR17]
MQRFDLIALDLDSTLLDWRDGEAKVSAACKAALHRAAAAGVQVVIATGRTFRETRLELIAQGLAWGDPVPHFVIAQEKFCYRVVNGKAHEDDALARWNAERAAEAREAIERFVLPNTAQWLQELAAIGLAPRRWVIDTGAGWFSLIYASGDEARQAEKTLQGFIAGMPALIPNRNAFIVGLIPRDGTKGKALRFLAQTLGIAPERVMAIGDSLNDRDMLNGEHGFFPVAVANAEPEIKDVVRAAGGLVTVQPASDGVAEAITWALAR